MPFIGNKPSAVPLTSADITDGIITSAKIADGTIVNADINASAGIASTKLSGVTSDYVLLASTDASSSASVSFDGYFTSTYKNYELILSDILPATNNTQLNIRLRKSNADITTSNYRTASHQIWGLSSSASAQQRSSWNGSSIEVLTNSQYNVATQSGNGRFTLYNPLGTTSHKKGSWIYNAIGGDAGSDGIFHIQGSFQLVDNANALSGISFYISSGNIASGNFKLYGIK